MSDLELRRRIEKSITDWLESEGYGFTVYDGNIYLSDMDGVHAGSARLDRLAEAIAEELARAGS